MVPIASEAAARVSATVIPAEAAILADIRAAATQAVDIRAVTAIQAAVNMVIKLRQASESES
jgi:hypothetical protein